jgi:hypothetical protein
MKQFSIHKVNKPMMRPRGATDGADEEMDEGAGVASKYMTGAEGEGSGDYATNPAAGHSSLLTAEEHEALQPKEIKVVNPWIHEATHKEYLESVKGLPARHANVIKKHKNVIREKTFLEENENAPDKDKETQEALKILDKEMEIFNGGPNLPSVKTLTRYDTWEEDKAIE